MTATAPYFTTDQDAALRAMRNVGIFWRLNLPTTTDGDQTLRLWMGLNDIPIGIEAIDDAGSMYTGAGRLLALPELEILINGLADRIEFNLSGVPSEVVAKIDDAAPEVKGQEVHVGIAPLDDNYQPVTSILPLWFGIADFWSIKMDPTQDSPSTRTITLSVGSGMTGRSRPRRLMFTDAAQRSLYPTDKFFDRVARYVRTYVVAWPRF